LLSDLAGGAPPLVPLAVGNRWTYEMDYRGHYVKFDIKVKCKTQLGGYNAYMLDSVADMPIFWALDGQHVRWVGRVVRGGEAGCAIDLERLRHEPGAPPPLMFKMASPGSSYEAVHDDGNRDTWQVQSAPPFSGFGVGPVAGCLRFGERMSRGRPGWKYAYDVCPGVGIVGGQFKRGRLSMKLIGYQLATLGGKKGEGPVGLTLRQAIAPYRR